MGDALLQKSYTTDTLPFRKKMNDGRLPKYYVENSNPAIVSKDDYKAAKELLRTRTANKGCKRKPNILSGKLHCPECGRVFRRQRINGIEYWMCSGRAAGATACQSRRVRHDAVCDTFMTVMYNRLDFGKKYCHNSPTIEEGMLQRAIMNAVMRTAKQNADVLKMLKLHIGMGIGGEDTEDKSLDIQIRIAEIDAEFKAMLQAVSAQNADVFDESKATALMNEKNSLLGQIEMMAFEKQKRENAKSRLDEIYTILDGLKNHPLTYDDRLVRQILECVIVESKEQIKVVFVGGLEVTESLE